MASHYSYGSRETLIIAIILDALLMLTYITLIAVVIAGIVAWMITASATVDVLATLTIGNAWHTVTCLMIDSMTQRYATGPGQIFYTQTSSAQTPTGSIVIKYNRHVDTNDG
ncbi:hypothetical protein LOAG_00972 [Loa loa]|uniref:G_PROTEIN_RECEP_F1_2 domain-containing protein n=1 Tax=Loa loa TaxID=7209 RepID=A0A1I7VT54_LOALO|nr:hypothetical protein LOAG_00972 [Loa loa]EFO27508.2 hypothetical protein LOAG_00972 [Loa loa]